MPAGDAQRLEGGGVGELDGEETGVLAEGAGGEELAAEDDASRGGGEGVVDSVAELGGDGLEGVVVGRHRCWMWCCSLVCWFVGR